MKLSNKEKMLLALLGATLVTVSYHQFIYINQKEKIEDLKEKKLKVETKYNEVMEVINSLEEKQINLETIVGEVNFKSANFYPMILQEKLILQIDEFLKKSTLGGDITFNDITIEPVEYLNKNKNKEKSSFNDIVDKYNGKEMTLEDEEKQDNKQQENIEKSSATVEILKVSINFKGEYKDVKSFISKLETSNREIAITDITTSVGYNGELSGTMNLEFYALPKLSSMDSDYVQWNIDGTYGKSVPYLIQEPEVVQPPTNNQGNDTADNTNTEEIKKDFVAIVKSYTSDLPTVMIGKSNDINQSTYVKTTKNNIEKSDIEIRKIDDKFYYKYKTTDQSYPVDFDGKGVEFSPDSQNIVIEVSSESRVNNDDKSGLELNIVNSTDKIVEVYIKGDDKVNPRVTITGNSKTIRVIRK